ncbi:MAG: PstS family phosphate ABC transporter substrate-binding protein [Firmicutes bacterium]|nr:PstS family phosphate ABC transporter substrate-binding protein [Bacillota bacterium]
MRSISRILKSKSTIILVALAALTLIAAGCGGAKTKTSSTGIQAGTVKVDGSSTVLPVSEAVASEFMKANPGINVTVGSSGTGGGFKKFIAGEIDIADASRPIEEAEKAAAKKNGIQYIEIPVAYDGITIIVNKKNAWAKSITTEELKKIWAPDSKINNWKQVRADWPDQKLVLYGPSSAHGTFDYFTQAINGKEKAIRTDYNVSEDYNVVVQGVQGDKGALGFLGYAYYKQNEDNLRALPIDAGSGPVKPTEETIKGGNYNPLSRQIYIYVNSKSLEKPVVKDFVKFYLTKGSELIPSVGYIPLNKADYDKSLKQIE